MEPYLVLSDVQYVGTVIMKGEIVLVHENVWSIKAPRSVINGITGTLRRNRDQVCICFKGIYRAMPRSRLEAIYIKPDADLSNDFF